MFLDVYSVDYPTHQPCASPSLSFEDDGTLWFLAPFLEAVHEQTGQRIEPGGEAVLSGSQLLVLQQQLDIAAQELRGRPARWVFQAAIQRRHGDHVMFERLACRSVIEGRLSALSQLVDAAIAAQAARLEFSARARSVAPQL